MDKERVAAILDEIGTLLEVNGENPFRCQAYHTAARALQQLEGGLTELVASGRLDEIRGIGKTLQEKVTTLVTQGTLPFYEDLKKKTPIGVMTMLKLPGMGPKKVKLLFDDLGIDDLAKLQEACQDGRVAALKGFGDKTQLKILEGIEFLEKAGTRVRIDQAEAIAQGIMDEFRGHPGIIRMEVCGSLRRRKETINDIDILISSADPGPLMDRFVAVAGVVEIVGKGETKSSIAVDLSHYGGPSARMNADLRIVSDKQFPFALHYFTGSKEHNVAVRARAQKLGLKLNEYELAGTTKNIACQEEADIFKALGLDYIPPELREHNGEIEAAEAQRLPQLIERNDLRGTFHCHSNWSDGTATIEEMAKAAKKLGLTYLGMGDHSQSLTIANGLSPERVRKQQEEIDALNSRLTGIKIFKGIECDILADGRLDFEDAVLDSFDYVVASVHSYFQQPKEEMTARIIRAIQNPRVTILGHATGRLLLRRDSYPLDMEAILQEAGRRGTMIEINSHPQRLDLDWVQSKRAKALGVSLVINPDAHNTKDLAHVRFGIDVARRAWLEKKDVFNTQSARQIAKALATRKVSK